MATNEKMIRLKSSDDQVIEISPKAAIYSEMIKNALTLDEDDDDFETREYKDLDVTRLDGATLEKVVEFLNHYKDERSKWKMVSLSLSLSVCRVRLPFQVRSSSVTHSPVFLFVLFSGRYQGKHQQQLVRRGT
jgi:hypothetical protein